MDSLSFASWILTIIGKKQNLETIGTIRDCGAEISSEMCDKQPYQTVNIRHFSEDISATQPRMNLLIASLKPCCKASSFQYNKPLFDNVFFYNYLLNRMQSISFSLHVSSFIPSPICRIFVILVQKLDKRGRIKTNGAKVKEETLPMQTISISVFSKKISKMSNPHLMQRFSDYI